MGNPSVSSWKAPLRKSEPSNARGIWQAHAPSWSAAEKAPMERAQVTASPEAVSPGTTSPAESLT